MKLGRAPTMFRTFMLESHSIFSSFWRLHVEISPGLDAGCRSVERSWRRASSGPPSGFQDCAAHEGGKAWRSNRVVQRHKGLFDRSYAAIHAETHGGTGRVARENGPGGVADRS